jgi:5-methylcytosine-specific restriction endonuclease McrA
MTVSEFQEHFRYQLALVPTSTPDSAGYKQYRRDVGKVMSRMIYSLRLQGVKGPERHWFNKSLQLLRPNFRTYLYRVDKNCQLCLLPIFTLAEATIDHIIPRACGGSNKLDNQQLAHGQCNVYKGCRMIQSFVDRTAGLAPALTTSKAAVLL